MSRVFMIMPHRDDVSRATRFGELTFIYDEHDRRPSIFEAAFIEEALARLDRHQFDPAEDYLLITGNMIPVVLIAAALAHECETPPRGLFWDKVAGEYQPMTLGLTDTVRS